MAELVVAFDLPSGRDALALVFASTFPLDSTYLDHQGRPRYIVENGEPLRELI